MPMSIRKVLIMQENNIGELLLERVGQWESPVRMNSRELRLLPLECTQFLNFDIIRSNVFAFLAHLFIFVFETD